MECCCRPGTSTVFQSPGVHLVQTNYSEVTAASLPCEHCQLGAGDTGDEKRREKERLGHSAQALTLWRQGEAPYISTIADCLTVESGCMSCCKAEEVGGEAVPGKVAEKAGSRIQGSETPHHTNCHREAGGEGHFQGADGRRGVF